MVKSQKNPLANTSTLVYNDGILINVIPYRTASGKNLITSYVESLSQDEKMAGRETDENIYLLHACRKQKIIIGVIIMLKQKQGHIKGLDREMRKLISKMDVTEEEYYGVEGSFAPMDVDSYVKECCEKDSEFAKRWAAHRLERELRRIVIEERERQNLTQKELAEKANLTQQQLSRLEVGAENSPSLFTVSKLLNALNLEVKFVPRSVE